MWVKAFGSLIIIGVAAWILKLWATTVLGGNYLSNAGVFMAIMTCAVPLFTVVVAFYALKFIVKSKPSDFNF